MGQRPTPYNKRTDSGANRVSQLMLMNKLGKYPGKGRHRLALATFQGRLPDTFSSARLPHSAPHSPSHYT